MTAIAINPKTLARGLKNGTYIETELGIEKRCTQCGQFWPVDDEFYFAQVDKGIERATSCCKACYLERYNRGAKPGSTRRSKHEHA